MTWFTDAASSVGGFVEGTGEGLYDGAKGMVEGAGTVVKGAYSLATSAEARKQAWDSAVADAKSAGGFAETAVTNPGRAAREIGSTATAAWTRIATAYDAAARSGQGAEFLGKIVGEGMALVGTAFIPGGAEADMAGTVADAGRAESALSDAGKLDQAADTVGSVSGAAEPDAGRATAADTATPARAGRADVAQADAAKAGAPPAGGEAEHYGVAFFGDSSLRYYTVDNATLGASGRSFFMMPLEDSPAVTDAGSAARYTGMSPSTLDAYKNGGDIYGLSFPTGGMTLSQPTAADAAGWPHFLEGGHTAVLTGDGPDAGYLVNPTREFVTPGGNPVPEGSVLFKLEPGASWAPVRRF
jgi:hypothetical protein